ncbi:Chloroperoxidase [Mariannaea sp. PMI_226]|nr:Chloroperoxidase [Mariannaea sp. PMI_226]
MDSSDEILREYPWHPPVDGDVRSPCPMVNALANHGFIPRNGKGITIEDLLDGITKSVNIDQAAVNPIAQVALHTSTTGNPETFNLDDLAKHDVIEHDGSLSRNDAISGDNHHFDPSVWAQTTAFFTDDKISVQTAADARMTRLAAAAAANPQFSLTEAGMRNSVIESALYLTVFSDGNGSATTKFVNVLFEEERVPYAEGYSRREETITKDEVLMMAARIGAASVPAAKQ